VATRADGDGVLLLSEFAGAASELGEALRVNPYDVDGMARAMKHALDMPESERRTRIKALRRRVQVADVHAWADRFLEALSRASSGEDRTHQPPTPRAGIDTLITELRSSPCLTLILDYDGTLVRIEDAPELATPDRDIVELLGKLSRRPNTTVHVASGRTRDTLERWFGGLDVHLWSEHGFWHRSPGAATWENLFDVPEDWAERIRPVLEQFTARTPGSLVEEKTSAMAWHYRMAEPEFGTLQARKLRAHLAHVLHNAPVEVLLGSKVVEIRLQGVNKGRVASMARRAANGCRIVAIGDDMTDEDVFAALPGDAVTIHVGPEPSAAGYRVPDVRSVRRILRALVQD
jgi:trehalose 6-phosphate synthase/phosphatase